MIRDLLAWRIFTLQVDGPSVDSYSFEHTGLDFKSDWFLIVFRNLLGKAPL